MSQFFFSFTRVSQNIKTGPIPVTSSESATCPDVCPLKRNGCYAELSFTGIHWRKLDTGKNALSWADLCGKIKALPKGQLWRHNVMGDLPHTGQTISADMMQDLIAANKGKKGFTYTHHDMENPDNRAIIKTANEQGFAVNLSANSPLHADSLADLDIGPVVTILPDDAPTTSKTPAGRTIVVCPAVTSDSVNCSTCGLCAKVDRRSIVGFPAHGAAKGKVNKVIMLKAAV